jgi:hypothetical protein
MGDDDLALEIYNDIIFHHTAKSPQNCNSKNNKKKIENLPVGTIAVKNCAMAMLQRACILMSKGR